MDAQRRREPPVEDRFHPTFTLLHMIAAGGSLPHSEAVAAFRRLYARDPAVDARLLQFMKDGAQADVPRILKILASVSDGKRLVQGLLQYLTHPEPCVRAEAAFLIARGQPNPARVIRMLEDPDPRVRSNVVEGFSTWNRNVALLNGPLRDPHHRVVCNALVALFALDWRRARLLLEHLLQHEDWKFRAAATWATGASGCAELYLIAERMQHDPHPSVRFNALRAMSALKRIDPAFAVGAAS